ncbi:MAG: threonine--tRNA ligase [Candidatus Bathyarchaeota archaeon]|nr:MAG: threonine--tRNA ligase [Candidatus Bathyarchaeota archaeon]
MRILQLHCKYIVYKPVKKEIGEAEEAEKKESRIDDVIVLFTAIEKGDDESVAVQAITQVKEFLGKLKVNRILIYPYAHLSIDLAAPSSALRIVKAMERAAQDAKIETYRAPFGWNKQFTISVKGHPLAEQSRVFLKEPKKQEKVSEALKAEEKRESSWYILSPVGDLVPVMDFDFSTHKDLARFSKYEISKMRASQEMPPHTKLMRKLEIADYEPGSDPGNLRWYPKGRLMKSLLEQFVTATMAEYGAMEVETPIMYDFHHPTLSSYLDRFPARQYLIQSEEKDLFLRFAACFGQFLILHDAQFSYRQLPLKIYELTRYSFRREKSGELAGLRRQRAFTMPDCHALCSNLKQAKEEFLKRFNLCMRLLEGLELGLDDYELGIRFTREFYDSNRDFITSLVKLIDKPALVEVFEERILYWVLKWEFNFIDNQEKASALSTDQLDVENARRYDITYIDQDGARQYPIVLHCSPSGGIERCIYALLEKAYKLQKKGKPPMFPLWLSPTQIRVIPVSDKFIEPAEGIRKKLADHGLRVDLDDRPLTMQKRIREAETEWINYVVAIGQKELDSNQLSVRNRATGEIKGMPIKELLKKVTKETRGKPWRPLPLPTQLSKRPQFYG